MRKLCVKLASSIIVRRVRRRCVLLCVVLIVGIPLSVIYNIVTVTSRLSAGSSDYAPDQQSADEVKTVFIIKQISTGCSGVDKEGFPIFRTRHKRKFKLRQICQFGQFILWKVIKIVATRSPLESEMHQYRFRLGLCPRPRWGAHSAFSDLLTSWILGGPTSKGKKEKEREEREREGRNKKGKKRRGRTERGRESYYS